MSRVRRFLRRSITLGVLIVAIVAALALMPAPARAESCDTSGSGLLSSLVCVPGLTLTPATGCAEETCATVNPPKAGDQTYVPAPRIHKPAKPPVAHRSQPVAPRRPPSAAPPVIRYREADMDPWFTSGSYSPSLPYDLPWFARRMTEPAAPAMGAPSRRAQSILDMLAPLRIVLIYVGLALLAAAAGVRRILAVH